MKFDLKNLPQSEIEIKVELDSSEWGEFVGEATKELSNGLRVNGFRPGHVPKDIAEKEIGQGKILEKAADLAVKKTYVRIILEKNVEAIGRPEIQVLKAAPDNPFEFRARVAVMPEVKLADYQKIAKSERQKSRGEIKGEVEEVEQALDWLQKSRTKYATVDRQAQKGDRVEIDFAAKHNDQLIPGGQNENHSLILGEGHLVPGFEDNLLGMKENEEKRFSLLFPEDFQPKDLAGALVDFEVKMKLVQEGQRPELNDEFACSLGNFKDLAALKSSICEGLAEEKYLKEKEIWRAKVLETIVQKSAMEIPVILADLELEKMMQELKTSLAQLGLDFIRYLEQIKKTEPELKKEWLNKAKERVAGALVLRAIADQKKIELSEPEIEAEMNQISSRYPSSESIQGQIDAEQLKEYTEGRLKNEKVFQLLENL